VGKKKTLTVRKPGEKSSKSSFPCPIQKKAGVQTGKNQEKGKKTENVAQGRRVSERQAENWSS